jgi:hypothetical protein
MKTRMGNDGGSGLNGRTMQLDHGPNRNGRKKKRNHRSGSSSHDPRTTWAAAAAHLTTTKVHTKVHPAFLGIDVLQALLFFPHGGATILAGERIVYR